MNMAAPALAGPPATPTLPAAEEDLYEVVNGQRVELPPMSIYASWIASLLQENMGPYAKARRLGTVVTEGLFILDPVRNLRRRPDLAFVSIQRWARERPLPEEGDWEVVPDLVVEVSSPNDLLDNILGKIHEYFAFGVRQVWLVVPKWQIVVVFDSLTKVRILSTGDELDGGSLLPGFRLPLVDLFQPKPQAENGAST
jgi:Uma2 family endonuclease